MNEKISFINISEVYNGEIINSTNLSHEFSYHRHKSYVIGLVTAGKLRLFFKISKPF